MKALALGIWLTASAALAAPLGDDGLHKPDWLQDSFLDLREDLAEASAAGKRVLITIEQRGCIYCAKMHSEIFPDPQVDRRLPRGLTGGDLFRQEDEGGGEIHPPSRCHCLFGGAVAVQIGDFQ